MHHGSGESMLRSVREPLLRRCTLGLAHRGNSRTGRATDASASEARRGRSHRKRGADEGGCCF
jgi:hypothetical protein